MTDCLNAVRVTGINIYPFESTADIAVNRCAAEVRGLSDHSV